LRELPANLAAVREESRAPNCCSSWCRIRRRSCASGPTQIQQNDAEKSHLSRLLPSRPRVRSLPSASNDPALDSRNRISGDGTQSALGLVLRRGWWGGRGAFG